MIDDLLAQAVTAYQKGDFDAAKEAVQQAQYDGFKNSEMEISIRTNRSAAISSQINQQFYDLIKLSTQPEQLTEFGYQVTTLLQDIEEQLPQLPTTREAQVATDNTATTAVADTDSNQDWNKVSSEINQRIQAAIQTFEQGDNKKAMLAVQDTYFDVFENSGMENKIGITWCAV